MPESEHRAGGYALFRRLADRLLANKGGLYTSIDELRLSPELAACWNEDVLKNMGLRRAEFLRRSVQIADRTSDGGLSTLLTEPDVSGQYLFNAFMFIG